MFSQLEEKFVHLNFMVVLMCHLELSFRVTLVSILAVISTVLSAAFVILSVQKSFEEAMESIVVKTGTEIAN